MLTDVRRALRLYLERPAFVIFATLSLSLGIGANVAIFSVANQLIWNPLPFDGGERVVHIMRRHVEQGFVAAPTPDMRRAWSDGVAAFDAIELYAGREGALVAGREPRVVSHVQVSPTLMTRLGIPVLLGRSLVPDDVGSSVAVIEERLWRQDFGARADVLGESIRIDGARHTIVGVRRGGFELPMTVGGPDIWTSLPASADSVLEVNVLGRMAPGVSLEQARAALRQFDAAAAGDASSWIPDVVPQERFLGRGFTTRVWMLFAAVGLVLLIACANVANMLLAAGLRRSREVAVKMALGASRWRVMRQLFSESVVVAITAAVAAVIIAYGVLRFIIALRPDQLGQISFVALDFPAVAFACLLAGIANATAGIAPAFRISHVDPASVLGGSRGAPGQAGRPIARHTLLVVQVALAIVLFVGAATTARAYWDLRARDPGFTPDRLGAIRLRLPDEQYPNPIDRRAWYAALLEDIRAIPDVQSATHAHAFVGWMSVVFGAPLAEPQDTPPVADAITSTATVSPGYFETVGMTLVEGRGFNEDDDGAVAVVNEAMARRYWPNEAPIGRRFRFPDDEQWTTVIGVAPNLHTFGLRRDDQQLQIHYLDRNRDATTAMIVVRGRRAFREILPAIQTAVWQLDPALPIRDATSANELLVRAVAQERFTASLLIGLAILALFLAAVGVYGVVALLVSLRLPELGVRVALGAKRSDIARTVFSAGLGPVLIGIACGIATSVRLQRVVAHVIPDMAIGDPWLFAASAIVFVAATLVACAPSWYRATSVDPTSVLSQE